MSFIPILPSGRNEAGFIPQSGGSESLPLTSKRLLPPATPRSWRLGWRKKAVKTATSAAPFPEAGCLVAPLISETLRKRGRMYTRPASPSKVILLHGGGSNPQQEGEKTLCRPSGIRDEPLGGHLNAPAFAYLAESRAADPGWPKDTLDNSDLLPDEQARNSRLGKRRLPQDTTPRSSKRPRLDSSESRQKRKRTDSEPPSGSEKRLKMSPITLLPCTRSPTPPFRVLPKGTTTTPLPGCFRLLDLPNELITIIAEKIEFGQAFAAFLLTCEPLREIASLPYLVRQGVVKYHSSGVVAVRLDDQDPSFAADLLSALPVFDAPVWVDVGIDCLLNPATRLGPFFKTQTISDLRIRLSNDVMLSSRSGTTIWALYSTIRLLKPGLINLTLDSSPDSITPSVQLHPPSVQLHPPPAQANAWRSHGDRVWDFRRLHRSLRCLTVSAEWSRLPYFSSLWSALAAAPSLLTVTLSEVLSQQECDSALLPLQSNELQNVYVLTACNSTISVSPSFLAKHDLQHLSILSIPTDFDPSPSHSTIMRLPAIADLRMTCNFLSLTAAEPEALVHLSMLPVCKYDSPRSAEYCHGFGQFLRGVKSVSAIAVQGLQLSLEFPWMVSAHFSARVPRCSCAQASSGFTVKAVKTVSIQSDDYSADALAYFFRYIGAFPDMEELHLNLQAAAFEREGGVSLLHSLDVKPAFKSCRLIDRTWLLKDGLWKPRE